MNAEIKQTMIFVQTTSSEFLAQKRVYSEFLDFVVHYTTDAVPKI
jgi:histone deacetylase complex regulatory component SIN3